MFRYARYSKLYGVQRGTSNLHVLNNYVLNVHCIKLCKAFNLIYFLYYWRLLELYKIGS